MANKRSRDFWNGIRVDLQNSTVQFDLSDLRNRDSQPSGLVVGKMGKKINSSPANPETSKKYTDKKENLKDILVGLATGALIVMVAAYALGAKQNSELHREPVKMEQSNSSKKIKIDTIEEAIENGVNLEELGLTQDMINTYNSLINEEVPKDEEHAKNYAARVGYFIQDALTLKLANCLHCDESEITLKPNYDKNDYYGSQITVTKIKYIGYIKEEEKQLYQETIINIPIPGIQVIRDHTFPSIIGNGILYIDQQFKLKSEDCKKNPETIVSKSKRALNYASRILSAYLILDKNQNILAEYRTIEKSNQIPTKEYEGLEPGE